MVRLSTGPSVDVELDVDLENNALEATVTLTEEISIQDLFVDGELRLWEDEAGWDGYLLEDGAYYAVNTRHDSDDWTSKMRVGERAVRLAIQQHIEDPDAGGPGRFVRGCQPL